MLDKIIHTTSALGIPIRFSLGWLVSVALYTWLLGAFCFPALMPGINPALSYSLGLANTLLVFAGVLAHELGHALAARRHGTRVEGINMGLLGGGARLYGDARTPIDGLRYALSGHWRDRRLLAGLGPASLLFGPGGNHSDDHLPATHECASPDIQLAAGVFTRWGQSSALTTMALQRHEGARRDHHGEDVDGAVTKLSPRWACSSTGIKHKEKPSTTSQRALFSG